MTVLINWIVSAIAILITAYLLPGVMVDGFGSALIVALVLGILNALVRPIFLALTLPINLLTLGFFTFIVNALLVMAAAAFVPGFSLSSFWLAVIFGIVLALITYILNWIVPDRLDRRV